MVHTIIKLDRSANSQVRSGDGDLSGRSFVIADDSPKFRSILRSILESIGMRFAGEAANGLECLSVVKRTKPDLVCLDVLMPVMHGVEALGCLREENFNGVIVFVTQLSSTEALAEIRPKGYQPDAIFSKSDGRDVYFQVLPDILAIEETDTGSLGDVENSA